MPIHRKGKGSKMNKFKAKAKMAKKKKAVKKKRRK